jgi:tetratricopeptide (TPR) repeat protein
VTGEWARCLSESLAAYNDGCATPADVVTAEACGFLAYAHLHGGRIDESRAALEEAIQRSVGEINEYNMALALGIKGMLLFATGDVDAGMALVEESRSIHNRKNGYQQSGVTTSFIAQMTFAKGDHVGALEFYREALVALEIVSDRPEIARVHCEMGWTALAAGDVSGAMRSFQLAVRVYEEVGSPRGTGLALMGLAAVEAAAERPERAVEIAAAADALSARAGVVVDHTMDPGVVARIEALKASIPRGTLDGLVANASALSPSEVLAMVGG